MSYHPIHDHMYWENGKLVEAVPANEIEQQLRRSLIAKRELGTEPEQAENKLYEHQLRVGSTAAYFTYERII